MNKHEEIPFLIHMTKAPKILSNCTCFLAKKIELEFQETVHYIFTFSYI